MRTPCVLKASANNVKAIHNNNATTEITTGVMLKLKGRAGRLWEPGQSKHGTETTLPVTSETVDLADCLG